MTETPSFPSDVIDAVVPLAPGDPVHALRRERPKVVDSTQASYEGMFAAEVRGISVAERLFAALHACRLSRADGLARHYRLRLEAEGADSGSIDQVDMGSDPLASDERLRTILDFTGKLIVRPLDGDRDAIEALVAVGLTTPAIVALSQLVSFLSYQIRVAAGLKALADATEAA
jgi:uncharacterized protein YciW